jgi:putative transposase
VVPDAGRAARPEECNTRVELANAIFDHFEIWHNRNRRHGQLGWLTPIEFERNRIIVLA